MLDDTAIVNTLSLGKYTLEPRFALFVKATVSVTPELLRKSQNAPPSDVEVDTGNVMLENEDVVML